jgi:non-heme chloroperoxidase
MTESRSSTLQRIVSHGAELIAESWGRPHHPTVVLLHGGGQTRHAWRRAGERLAELGFYALIPDLRGHGESAWSPDGRYSPELYADDVRAWCALSEQPPALVALRSVVSAPWSRPAKRRA